MSLWRHIARGIRVVVNQSAADRDVDDELAHYLEEAIAAHEARGIPPDEARRLARLEMGSVAAARQQVRESAWEWIVSASLADLRYAARRLGQSPAFALVGISTLALGIGATTAVFSVINPILFVPLPYPQPSRIVTVWDHATDGAQIPVAFGTVREVADRNRSFEAVAAFKPWQPTLTGGSEPERLDGQSVGADYFRVLGVRPIIGRDFEPADDVVRGPKVVIVSYTLWRRQLAADPGAVGRGLTLNGALYTVIGVMPAAFDNVLSPAAEVWAPLQYDRGLPLDGREWGHHLRVIARLRASLPLGEARRDLDAIARTRVPQFARAPWASLERGLTMTALQDDVTRGVRPALLAVLGAVLLLLVIACVNVTNLLLARSARRRGEFAMRQALGAGRARLVRQLLTESALLALVGGVLGVGLAAAGVRALAALAGSDLPRAAAIAVDSSALAFALATTTVVGLLVGLVPALDASRHLGARLQEHSARLAGGHRRARQGLVVCEVALAVVLLVSAALLVRSLQRLFAVLPGFDAAHVVTMQVQVSGTRYADGEASKRFFREALDAVQTIPGVAAAGWTSQLPLSGDFDKYGAQFESSPTENRSDDHSALRYAVTPGYFAATRIGLRRGRLLDARDEMPGAPVAVLLSESLARRRFPGLDPIGQRMHLGSTDQPWFTVVGVVNDVKQTSLAVADADAVYVPAAQWYFPDRVLSLVVRAHGDPLPLLPLIRAAIWSVDKDQPIVRVATLEQLVAQSAAERRFARVVFEVFAVVALVLAAIGIYGVLSGTVGERTREIGIRAALGASRGDVVRLVVGQGMALTVAGALVGIAAAAAASRALVTLLFAISPVDPGTYALVVAVLIVVSASACALPALRAAAIDPVETLRAE